MSNAKITMLGLQSYMKHYEKDLFELLNVPEGIDKETLVNNILLKGSEFEVLYSQPEFFHDMIGVFSDKWQRTFTKWVEALNVEYSPLENYDRIEDWDEKKTSANNINNTGSSNTSDSGNTDNVNQVSAYNSNLFQDDSHSTGTTSGTTNSSNSFNGSESGSNTLIKSGRTHGNIGVTTSQQMLQAELDIVTWNVYEHITDLFLKEFCILVY